MLVARNCWLAALVALASTPTVPGQPLTRVPATSLRLSASTVPTTYSTTQAFPLSFNQPLALVTPPGEARRLFVVEKIGRIWLIPDVTAPTPTRILFLDLSARVATGEGSDERGLLALAFHPGYASNGQFYIWYTLDTSTSAGAGLHDRLSRFRVSANNPNAADAASEQPLISQHDEAANHNGGQLLFGPDGYLYLSLGDEGGGDDQYQNSQRIDRDFFSGVLRLDVDQRPGSLPPNPHPAVHPGTYSVPPDNPFVGARSLNGAPVAAGAVRTEFWAIGLRNPWRMSFDATTGQLWCADVGQNAREEIDVIVRGGNYGWNFREGTLPGPRGSPPGGVTFIPPIWDYPNPAQGSSIIGGLVYRGTRYPGLVGRYLFADFVSGRIWSLLPDGTNPVSADRVQLLATDGGIASFGLDPSNGDILLADLTQNVIKRLVTSGGGGASFPATLSATGAFADTAALAAAPGVVAYAPRVSAWADHARVRHWFALPDLAGKIRHNLGADMEAPPGAVWLQHFDLDLRRGDATTARRIETRVLVLTNDGGAYGLSYRWNDAQTDATLVPVEGASQVYSISDNGLARTQTWPFPARADCLACHVSTAHTGFPFVHHALGFNSAQLNRDYALPGGSANLLLALSQAGYFDVPFDSESLRLQPTLVDPVDASSSIEQRAVSYLTVNCGPCHRPGGTAPSAWTPLVPLAQSRIVNGELLDPRGDPGNRVLAPGDIAHSQLLARMAGTRDPRMPPIASSERDREAERLLVDWIVSLQPNRSAAPGPIANLAARAPAAGIGNELITGFVLNAGGAKTMLVRGIGPRLADFGVANPLTQPALTLFREAQPIDTNVRWNSAPNAAEVRAAAARVGAFALPENSADSALLVTLEPGAYTARVASSGADNTGGIALIEVYDVDPVSNARLANASIRGRVGAGSNLLIPGLVIGPGGSRTLLIRAIGPALKDFGVSEFLTRPALQLFAGPQEFAENIGWSNSPHAAAIRAAARQGGAFALADGSQDSALLITLSPGAYTLQVSGVGGATGAALVEIYEAAP